MFAGLPGTGIGGVFYLLLTMWMPIHELYLLYRGRSTRARWRFIAGRWAIFSVVIFVMWVQIKLLKGIFPQGGSKAAAELADTVGVQLNTSSGSGVLVSSSMYAAFVLIGVIATVHMIRLGFWYKAYLKDLAHELDLKTDWTTFTSWISRALSQTREIALQVVRAFRKPQTAA